MTRLWRVTGFLALLVGAGLTLNAIGADKEKEPTIKEIMTKAHKGGNSLIQKLGKELKAADPEWEAIQKQAKDLVKLGTSLGKNDPPKGEKDSWEKLTKEYLDNAKSLEKAANDKNKEKATESQKALSKSCMACHKAHKGK
jgi:hypothetical protein